LNSDDEELCWKRKQKGDFRSVIRIILKDKSVLKYFRSLKRAIEDFS